MGKKAKDHRKKVAKRNEVINLEKKKIQKKQEEYLKKIIEQEKNSGKFDNIPPIPGVSGPLLDIQGPSI
jgi:hypothetical protein